MHKRAIAEWVLRVAADKSYRSFNDLHVDEIASNWKRRDRWIDAAVETLNVAAQVRNQANLPFTVAVGFSLISNPSRFGVSARVLRDLLPELEFSPPSLYLFPRNEEPWTTDDDFQLWTGTVFAGEAGAPAAYFREWYDKEEDQYHRSFWLAR